MFQTRNIEANTPRADVDGMGVLSACNFAAYHAVRIGLKHNWGMGHFDNVRAMVPTYGEFDGYRDVDASNFLMFAQSFTSPH